MEPNLFPTNLAVWQLSCIIFLDPLYTVYQYNEWNRETTFIKSGIEFQIDEFC